MGLGVVGWVVVEEASVAFEVDSWQRPEQRPKQRQQQLIRSKKNKFKKVKIFEKVKYDLLHCFLKINPYHWWRCPLRFHKLVLLVHLYILLMDHLFLHHSSAIRTDHHRLLNRVEKTSFGHYVFKLLGIGIQEFERFNNTRNINVVGLGDSAGKLKKEVIKLKS